MKHFKKTTLFVLGLLIITFLASGTSTASGETSLPNDVEVDIIFPYSGNYNDWFIEFNPPIYINGGESIEFDTDNNTQSLGNIPEGTYNSITFDCGYFPSENFEIRICGDATFNSCQSEFTRDTEVTFYNVEIGPGARIIIDEGY